MAVVLALPCLAGNPKGTHDVPVVAAARVERGDIFREASFDAELRPYHEVALHARVTRYLDAMKVDAGAIKLIQGGMHNLAG
jgi:hypothetical protein